MKEKVTLKKKIILTITILLLLKVFVFDANPQILSFILPHKKGDFVRVGNMNAPRGGHKAVLLDDGRVLMLGGSHGGKHKFKGDEIYNPKTRKFKKLQDRCPCGKTAVVVKLKDGRFLITGGRGVRGNNTPKDEVYLFDPKINIYEKGDDMITGRMDHTATLLNDGRVFVVGGTNLSEERALRNKGAKWGVGLKDTEIYDPKTNRFTQGPNFLTESIRGHASILLQDGRVLIANGRIKKDGVEQIAGRLWTFNPKTNKFDFIGKTNVARSGMQLYLLKDGRVVILGGSGYGNIPQEILVKEIEIFDPKTNKVTIAAKANPWLEYPQTILLPDDTILFTGGSTSVGLGLRRYKRAEIFDPKTNEIKEIKPGMKSSRSGHRMTLLKDGNVLITGSDGFKQTAEVYMFNDKIGE